MDLDASYTERAVSIGDLELGTHPELAQCTPTAGFPAHSYPPDWDNGPDWLTWRPDVTDRSGCGLAELTVLQVVDELSGCRRGEAASAEVLAEVDRRIGLGPAYAYPMVCDLVTPWVMPVTLVAMNGSPYDRVFPQPAPAAHTECRLCRAGELVVAAEAGAIAPVPAGLINGTWWRGGAEPPLDPFGVIAALRKLIEDPGLPDGQLLQVTGRPVSLTGSELTGDFDALARGQRTTIREAPRITRTDAAVPPAPAGPRPRPAGPFIATDGTGRPPRPVHLIIDAVPRHLSAGELAEEISGHIRPVGWQPSEPPPGSLLQRGFAEARERLMAKALPIAYMSDESRENDIRLEITLRPGADPQAVQAQLAGLGALGTDTAAQFPAPLADLLRSWVTTRRHEDITASLNLFEAAVRADRLDLQASRE